MIQWKFIFYVPVARNRYHISILLNTKSDGALNKFLSIMYKFIDSDESIYIYISAKYIYRHRC